MVVLSTGSSVGAISVFVNSGRDNRNHTCGRESEREMARAFVLDDAVPLLRITDPGEVGKTRLALASSKAQTTRDRTRDDRACLGTIRLVL